jgi:hypothetical protein
MDYCQNGRIVGMLEAADAKAQAVGAVPGKAPGGAFPPGCILLARPNLNKGNQGMTKTLEVISEMIRNPKHPFRKVENQPKKPRKHRYERRKIRAYLQLGAWASGEAT